MEEIYPLLINELRIHDGLVAYVGDDREHPLVLESFEAVVENIRNVASPEATYPSTVEATAMVFGEGPARLEGRADFLAEPHSATVGEFSFERVPLDRLQPIIESYQVTVSSGTLSAHGELEYTPNGPARRGRGGGDRRRAHRLRERSRAHRARGRRRSPKRSATLTR